MSEELPPGVTSLADLDALDDETTQRFMKQAESGETSAEASATFDDGA